MVRTAVILTVYNRKEITLHGLCSLSKAIEYLGEDYTFDIYMTDDGCTDGTGEAVIQEFPQVKIIKGDGKLYWSGGMRKAWQAAIDSGAEYDFYLWFNDDADLYEDALVTLFKDMKTAGNYAIITGAFCDAYGKTSYGGKTKQREIVSPQGEIVPIELMNGNLVLVPKKVYDCLGMISVHYQHGFGDYDYALRAKKDEIPTFLSSKHVGETDRHDEKIPTPFSLEKGLIQRWRILHHPMNKPATAFRFNLTHFGMKKAMKGWMRSYLYLFFPKLYYIKHHLC